MGDRLRLLEEVEGLRIELSDMGRRLEKNLVAAPAFRIGDSGLLANISAAEEVINTLQVKIEDEIAIIIATQGPAGLERFVRLTMSTIFKW